ncbi:MAG: hypothetical protein JJU29_21850 [Verrucomicrobia bacterium]|nr:hypothetical protein [Verrucomicrobiota bacterium]MCH8512742.1 hypothetical protein [Kiritimatiellia bacterium]
MKNRLAPLLTALMAAFLTLPPLVADTVEIEQEAQEVALPSPESENGERDTGDETPEAASSAEETDATSSEETADEAGPREAPTRHRAARDWPENPKIMIIPVEQPIMQPQQFLLQRGVRRARAEKVDALILVMDTPGGRVDIMREMVSNIIDLDIPTYTFVKENAFSAGAIIALATDHIFMTPMSVIGDAMPILMSPGGGMQELGEAEREKIESAMDAIVRSIAQAKNRDEMLIRAMVRRELHYELEDGTVISEKGNILTLTNTEAERIKPDGTPLLSEGTVTDLDEMLEIIGLGHAERLEEIPTWADDLAVFLTTISPLLLTLALVLFYMEINSPGIGWMAGLALTFFLIVMFGHNVAGLAGMEDILLIVIGMLLIMVELLVIPGFGFVGISGILLMIYGLIKAMIIRYPGNPGDLPGLENFGNVGPAVTNLSIAFIASVVLMVLLINSMQNSKFANKKLILQETIGGDGTENPLRTLVGRFGQALTPLGPSGTADIGGQEFSVVSDGEYVERGTPLEITDVHGNRIIVRPRAETKEENA